MRRAYVATVLALALWSMQSQAQDSLLAVQVVSLPAKTPLEQVRADLYVQGRLQSPAPLTDEAGRIRFDLQRAARSGEHDVTVTLSLHKTAFRRVDLTRVCKVSGPSGCSDITVEMEPVSGSSVLTEEEKRQLDRLVSNVGLALFLTPYQQLSAGDGGQVSLQVLAISLDRTIATQIQALERAQPNGSEMEPLPTISLIPLSSQAVAIPPTNFEKLRSVGEYVQALAVISGSTFAAHGDRLEVSSNFLIIPGPDARVRQRQRIDDPDLPAPINPFELETRLSPAWGYNTLLALGLREYALAKAAPGSTRRAQLLRVYRYLAAARADASARNAAEVGDLNTMIELIESELGL
jgi:hypothetical protein